MMHTGSQRDLSQRAGLHFVLLAALLAGFAVAGNAQQSVNEFPIPTAASQPYQITMGMDGNLWFGEFNTNKIGRITTGGVISEFPVLSAGSGPAGITAGPDGNLWFTELNGNRIGRITLSGTLTEFPVPTANSGPLGIATGPD